MPIPRTVHQTFKSANLPAFIADIVAANMRLCPQYAFRFYDDEDCKKFIRRNFDRRVNAAYHRIADCYGAMKADFFRYCVLFVEGGVYLDIKSRIIAPLHTVIRDTDECVLDFPRGNLEPWRAASPTFEQWALLFAPRHPYLRHMLSLMVSYIENGFEPRIRGVRVLTAKQKILHVTGPDALAKAVRGAIVENGGVPLHRCVDYNRVFVRADSLNQYRAMYAAVGRRHYSEYTCPLYKTSASVDGDDLGQIFGPIGVDSPSHRQSVCDKLEVNHGGEGGEDGVVGELQDGVHSACLRVADAHHARVSGNQFVNGDFRLGDVGVVQRNYGHGKFALQKRKRSMFQCGARVGLAVEVGHFLDFERPLFGGHLSRSPSQDEAAGARVEQRD